MIQSLSKALVNLKYLRVMTKEEKKEAIDKLTGLLAESKNVYLADISGMDLSLIHI